MARYDRRRNPSFRSRILPVRRDDVEGEDEIVSIARTTTDAHAMHARLSSHCDRYRANRQRLGLARNDGRGEGVAGANKLLGSLFKSLTRCKQSPVPSTDSGGVDYDFLSPIIRVVCALRATTQCVAHKGSGSRSSPMQITCDISANTALHFQVQQSCAALFSVPITVRRGSHYNNESSSSVRASRLRFVFVARRRNRERETLHVV